MKFRIGNHKLMIETGRYSQIPRVNRLCPTCGSNQIEDEIHLLFHCPTTIVLETGFTESRVLPTIYKTIVYIGSYKRINEF